MTFAPNSGRKTCRYCDRSFETAQDRLDHEVSCGFEAMGQ